MGNAHAILVVDLAFGDCGKGTIIDFLSRGPGVHTVVRFNGGPQAGHNVITSDGRHHTFSQFGSGSFVAGVRTLLSEYIMIEPYAMLNEAAHLNEVGVSDCFERLLIDGRCAVITPAQQAANRLRELARGTSAHGTCGLGVGELMRDRLDQPGLTMTAAQLTDRSTVKRLLGEILEWKRSELASTMVELRDHPRAAFAIRTLKRDSWIDTAMDVYQEVGRRAAIVGEPGIRDLLRSDGTVLFEGAQGVLLDEHFGFHPHTSWSTTTFANADRLLDAAGFSGRRIRVGVVRSYFTRHGAGPFVTEDSSLRTIVKECHNPDDGWQGPFRAGHFDAVAARYALGVSGGVNMLAVTHLDRIEKLQPRMCNSYQHERSQHVGDPDHELFIRNHGEIVAICVPKSRDFARQTRLTQGLLNCRPARWIQISDPVSWRQMVQSELDTPVGIVSNGPAANDKQQLMPLE